MAAPYQIELLVTGEGIDTTTLQIGEGEFLIGRSPSCAIRFPDDQASISRQHARLVVTPGAVEIDDLDSSSGTMVNGRIINSIRLENMDMISIGTVTIVVTLPEEEGAAPRGQQAFELARQHDPEESARRLEQRLADLAATTDAVMAEVGKRIIGQKDIVRSVWATILARGHCLMIGVPGLAKTYLVNTFAEVLGIRSNRIQFTPDLMPSDILGSNILQVSDDGRKHMEFIQGPIFTQLLLADEINRTPPKTQAALLEAMQERQVTIANKSLNLPAPFCVIATQNPIEQEGTYPLPEAQQDRFMLCLYLDYPERSSEIDILLKTADASIPDVDAVLNAAQIIEFQKVVDDIAVSQEAAEYAVDIVRRTRPEVGNPDPITETIDWGAGPRAGQSLLRAAKALAAMDGRPAISRQDIKDLCIPVLRHRIACNYRARTEGIDEPKIIEMILEEVGTV